MTIGCEINQILLTTLKNHLKRYILGKKCITIIVVTTMVTIMVTTIVTMMVTMINLGYHRSN